MKNLITLTALALASSGIAQSWDVENYGKISLVGCYGKQDGVYCDFSFTLTKKQTASLRWYVGDFKIFKQDGTSQLAEGMAFIDGNFKGCCGFSSTQEIISGVPVKVQAYFNTPSSTSAFRALAYKDVRFDNIPIRPYGSASKTPAPLPSAPSVTGFSIALSNCQLQGQNYVCTAVLTPTK